MKNQTLIFFLLLAFGFKLSASAQQYVLDEKYLVSVEANQAVRMGATGGQLGAFGHAASDGGLDLGQLLGRGERAEIGIVDAGADAQRVDGGRDTVRVLVGDAAVHDQPDGLARKVAARLQGREPRIDPGPCYSKAKCLCAFAIRCCLAGTRSRGGKASSQAVVGEITQKN